MAHRTPHLDAAGNAVDTSHDNPLPVAGSVYQDVYEVALAFARTADTNQYTAGDVLGINAAGSPGSAIHALASAGPAGALMTLEKLQLDIENSSVPSGMANFRLHLYDASPTAILDNAAFDLTSTDKAKHLGWVDLPTPEDLGSMLKTFAVPMLPVKLASGQTSLYFELETRGTYTPASGTTYRVVATFTRRSS
jgi:hypothetical protein